MLHLKTLKEKLLIWNFQWTLCLCISCFSGICWESPLLLEGNCCHFWWEFLCYCCYYLGFKFLEIFAQMCYQSLLPTCKVTICPSTKKCPMEGNCRHFWWEFLCSCCYLGFKFLEIFAQMCYQSLLPTCKVTICPSTKKCPSLLME